MSVSRTSHSMTMSRRVLFPFVGDTVGGSHVSTLALVEGIDRARFEPVVAVHEKGLLQPYMASQGYSFIQAPALPSESVGRGLVREMVAVLSGLPRLVRFIRWLRIDIVHTNDHRMHVFWMLAAKLAGAKLVWHVRSPGISRRFRLYSRLADAILTVSNHSRDLLAPNVAIRPQVVRNPFRAPPSVEDSEKCRQKLPALRTVVGFVANFTHQKRPLVFVETAALLRDRFGDGLLFPMFGDTRDMKHKVEAKIAEHDLTSQCLLMGPCFPIEPWLMCCDVLVAPAVNEAYGRTLVEAMLCGTPVVATDEGGHREIVRNGETGLLVSPDDPASFADAVALLLEQPITAQAMAIRAKTSAAYPIDAHALDIEQIYDALLQ